MLEELFLVSWVTSLSNGKQVFIFDELMRALDRSWGGGDGGTGTDQSSPAESKRDPKQETPPPPIPISPLVHLHVHSLPLSVSLSAFDVFVVAVCAKVFCLLIILYVRARIAEASDVHMNNSFSLRNMIVAGADELTASSSNFERCIFKTAPRGLLLLSGIIREGDKRT